MTAASHRDDLSPLKRALYEIRSLRAKVDDLERDRLEPIAIVGAGLRFPGNADRLADFWSLLFSGVDAVGEIPPERWSLEHFYDPDPDAPGKMSTRDGALLTYPDKFDADFFGISPREAIALDPQHRLFLETAWEALEHAGYSPAGLAGSTTGVFLALSNSDYGRMVFAQPDQLDAYASIGNLFNAAAGRISFSLGLHGPAMAVDTACSASLVAVHLACQSLRMGECGMALAGGANLILSPEININFTKSRMMAADGRCKSFDSRADGYVRGEGSGVVVLKRLRDAERDGDRIQALIRGSAVNQDGRSSGLTAPNGLAQEALLRRALSAARLSAGDIDYIEAHGTGTSLGDPIEAHALASVFGPDRGSTPLVVGSVKTNIGHLEAAAGIAGLIKTVLSLEHEHIPRHLHFRSMNPHIDWGGLQVEIPVEGRAWPRGERVRRAGVSSFGFSGTNAHVILEEAPLPSRAARTVERPLHLLGLSARTPEALEELRERYREELKESAAEAGDICFTANAGRTHFEERTFYVGKDREQLLSALERAGPRGRKEGTPAVAYLFSGQGAQYAGMGRELYASQPVFRAALDRCAEMLRAELGEPLQEVLWGSRTELLVQTRYTQPALFAVEWSLSELWRSWGLEPAMVAGHSVGEYVAATVAGVVTLEAGLGLIAARGRLMQECAGEGVMSAVRASAERVEPALRGLESRVSLGAVNAPESVVISGYREAVEEVEQRLCAAGVEVKRLAVSHGFHSPQMEEMEERFAEVASRCEYRAPSVQWISGVTGEPVGTASVDAGYWRRQVRQPVQWAQAMAAMERQQAAIYLEVGPGTTLVGLGRQCVEPAERVWVPSLRSARGEWEQILDSLGRIYLRGAEIDWNAFDQPYHRRRTPLPTYPFQRKRFWVDGFDRRRPKRPASEPPANWFYQLSWEPKLASGYAGPPAEGDTAGFDSLKTTAEQLRIKTGFDEYDKVHPSLDGICAAFIVRAFRRLGFAFTVGMEFASADLARTLGVAAQHLCLFDRLLAILSEQSIVRADGEKWVIVQDPATEEPGLECRALESKFPPFCAEIEMLRRCGEALAEVLSGQTDPLRLLFSEGSFESAEQLYTESPGLRVFNGLAASAIEEEVRRRPGRKLRILEIGAGTGATTAWTARVLPPDRTEYCYTDISAAFLTRAKNKFKDYPFFQYRTLDIERDSGTQGFEPGQFDIIIAANVLHATTDLGRTMRHVRSLLAPSGVVLLVEGIRPEAWVDLTFGLTEGWWRFRDHELRPSYPLISQEKWVDLLAATGFCGADAIRAGDSQVAIILARAPHTEIAQRWLVVPDRGGVAAEFTSLLARLGGSFEIANAEQARALLEDEQFHGVCYLPALDCPPSGELSADSLADATIGKGAEILHLAQAVIKKGGKLWTVTRTAQRVTENEGDLNVAQAPTWGWSKTIALEHPDCGGGVIDLDPSASNHESASAIVDAIVGSSVDNEDQVAMRNGARYVPRLQRSPAPAQTVPTLSKEKIYLITGGLGGLGLGLARWMAQRGARRLILAGRTALPNRAIWDSISADSVAGERIAAVREVESFGAEVSLRALDICDQRQVEELFASLPGELGGIFHLAAAGEMSPLTSMTAAGVREVMAPKTLGTWNLHVASRDKALDFFVMFSSWAAVLGVQDLGHYNAANQFIDAVAHYRRSLHLPAISVNWGTWDVIRNVSAELRSEIERFGLQFMPSAAAFTAMYRAASAGTTQLIIADVDWRKLKPLYETRRPRPILTYVSNLTEPSAVYIASVADGLTNQAVAEQPSKAVEPPRANLREEILSCSTGERIHRLESYVASVLAAVIANPGDQLAYSTATDELGLDSLMALEARNQVNAELGIDVPVVRFLQGLTITELAAEIATELSDDILAIEPLTAPDPSLSIDDSFGLSFAQRAYWVVQRVAPDSITSNCAFTAKASPFLQFDAFERAVWKLMERHAILRTVIFETEDGEPRQRVQTSWRSETTLIDAAGLTEQEFAGLVEREFNRSFDVTKSVFRIPVFRRDDCDVLLFVFHHIAVDGTSMPLCLGELRDIYTAELTGQSAQLSPVRATFKDFVDWESKLVNGPGMRRLWNYWKQELDGDLPLLTLPSSRPRPASFLPRGEQITLEFDSEITHAIHESARQSKATTFAFLLSAFQILLFSYSGQDDLLVGTTSSGRDLAKWENTVGCLINVFPIRSRLSRIDTFAEQLTATRGTILAALDHQGIPFSLLVDQLRVRRDFGCPPLFQAFFNFLTERSGDLGRFLLGVRDATVQFGNSVLTPWMNLTNPETQSDIMLYLVDFGEEICGYIRYNADVVDESVVRSMTTDYLGIVRAIVANPNIPIPQLPITSFPQSETEPEELLL